jgi:hypothetical protein
MNDIDNGAYYIVAITVGGSVKYERVYASSTLQAREIARRRYTAGGAGETAEFLLERFTITRRPVS